MAQRKCAGRNARAPPEPQRIILCPLLCPVSAPCVTTLQWSETALHMPSAHSSSAAQRCRRFQCEHTLLVAPRRVRKERRCPDVHWQLVALPYRGRAQHMLAALHASLPPVAAIPCTAAPRLHRALPVLSQGVAASVADPCGSSWPSA
eukprot:TRINITY_DN9161_c0_g1_i1.p1 TRINITY_DN9161_c0_g1~~TRINITY_DN9161_c0_g1_i1.p1  ORF type:complete len:148 (+),score=15.19 TRINITY_DN9161_c0_g1_i1:257-700(+)